MSKDDFDAFRKSGPWFRMGDLDRAHRRWTAQIKTPEDLTRIELAKSNYAVEAAVIVRQHIKRGDTEHEARGFVMHFSTWMNRWRDYIDEERVEALEDEAPHYHSCSICGSLPHDWLCADPQSCSLTFSVTCPEGAKMYWERTAKK